MLGCGSGCGLASRLVFPSGFVLASQWEFVSVSELGFESGLELVFASEFGLVSRLEFELA